MRVMGEQSKAGTESAAELGLNVFHNFIDLIAFELRVR